MKLKKLKQISVGSYTFKIIWDKTENGAWFSFADNEMSIGIKNGTDEEIFMMICHELFEICAIVMGVRYLRPDCDSDYLFSFDHRQHTTLCYLHSAAIAKFIN